MAYEAREHEIAQVRDFGFWDIHCNAQAQHHSCTHTQSQFILVLLSMTTDVRLEVVQADAK